MFMLIPILSRHDRHVLKLVISDLILIKPVLKAT